MRSTNTVDVLRAALHVPQKHFHGIETIAQLALTSHAMLETFLKLLVFLDLGIHLNHATLLLANSLTEHPIGLLDLLQLLFQLLDLLLILLYGIGLYF